MDEQDSKKSDQARLRRVQQLGQRAKLQSDRLRPEDGNLYEDLTLVAKTIWHLRSGCIWIYQHILLPIIKLLPWLKNIWYGYKSFWYWFCYPQEKFFTACWHCLRLRFGILSVQVRNLFRKYPQPIKQAAQSELGKFSKPRAGIFIMLSFLLVA